MASTQHPAHPVGSEAVAIACGDGVVLGGHLCHGHGDARVGSVIINCATGVLARYYHRYARFLAGQGYDVLTYDYRGIGESRPGRLRGCGYRWREWGTRDFEAALRFMHAQRPGATIAVVGHSIGGFLPGLAPSTPLVARMLTVGAQYAWWGDYARAARMRLFAKWHVAMPALTALFGYFPGRRLGWLEDLPAGVANEWSFRGRRFEESFPRADRQASRDRMRAVTAPILAISLADDEIGTVAAVRRTLDYYAGADRTLVQIRPSDFGRDAIGHFALFHDSYAETFWTGTLRWLRDGHNPWPYLSAPVVSSHSEAR
ncbi:alpha/beta fold hydrolase [Sphingomonas sp. QA11]|uniref:alpha/beta hydrolase family protein n=1 Tax=Sphingomonas sp. QA11 TaxID=2950605 RepID=UPI00234A5914|nr:alpha/beta fold hydrolase [Sphingomonas sp. QA11]WCM25976.1 alpha/beta fold hydrolase [Sphingomonas sp. QA11]